MSVAWGKRYRIKLHFGPNQQICFACAASFQDAVLIASALACEGATIDDIEFWERTESKAS